MAANDNPFASYLDLDNPTNEFARSLLETSPEAAYYSSPMGRTFGARSPRRQRYFQQNYQNVHNQYLGALGTAYRTGSEWPDFTSFLEQQDPWTSAYTSLPQQQRGVGSGLYNPRTRFLYY